jgi:hypothetical protein
MKKFVVLISIAVVIFFLTANASAWDVFLINNTSSSVRFEIYGEHLFWTQVDCTKVVNAASSDTCSMPGGICPAFTKFTVINNAGRDSFSMETTRFAKCMNTKSVIWIDGSNKWNYSSE